MNKDINKIGLMAWYDGCLLPVVKLDRDCVNQEGGHIALDDWMWITVLDGTAAIRFNITDDRFEGLSWYLPAITTSRVTMRGQNMQNLPKSKKGAKLRKALLPRKGTRLCEVSFPGADVGPSVEGRQLRSSGSRDTTTAGRLDTRRGPLW